MVNKAIRGLTGILRIATICLGLLFLSLVVAFEAYAYNDVGNITVVGTFVICFIFSVVWLIILMTGAIHQEKISQRIDWISHLICGILILLSLIPFIVLGVLILAALLSIQAIVYLLLAFFLFKSKLGDDNVGNVNYGDNVGNVNYGGNVGSVNYGDSIRNVNYGVSVSSVNNGDNVGSVNNGDSVGNVKGDVSVASNVNNGKPNG